MDDMVQEPIWDYNNFWQGQLSAGEKLALGLNLLVLAVGIGYAARRWQLAGLAPLAVHLGYHLSNAISRTSGGRYLVPVDWILVVYFVLGLASIYFALRGWQTKPAPVTRVPDTELHLYPAFAISIGFFLLGSTFLLTDQVQPKYPPNSAKALLAEQVEQKPAWFSENEITARELEAFINSDQGVVELGLMLYPRYYKANETPPRSVYLPAMAAGDNRITFLLLEEYQPFYVRLPLGERYYNQFPHAEYALVVGCQQDEYLDGILVIPLVDPDQEPILPKKPSLNCPAP